MTSQRAREAAAEYYCCPEGSPLADDILMGKADDMKIIQAFARFEQETALRIAEAMQEAAAQRCRDESVSFLSPEYATQQPWSSFNERFACGQCERAILAIDTAALIEVTEMDDIAKKLKRNKA